MVKTREHSRIEVWSAEYINNPEHRHKEDKKAVIVQIEPAKGSNYMVEVVNYG